jgi:hypothetical protein
MGSKEAAEATYKAFRAKEFAGAPGPGRVMSDEERRGMSPTDPSPRPVHGVGETDTRRAEDIARSESEEGRYSTGAQGRTQRPAGKSTAEDSTGVAPEGPIDPESPTMPRGD